MGLPLFCDTPSAKRNKPRTPEQRAAPHPGDVPENVLDELCDGAIRELDHFELGLPAGDEQIAKLLDDKRAELRRLIRTYPDVRRIVETAARAGKERVILVKPRVPVSGHDGSGIDVERVSFTPISAYVFYFVINSTSRLQLAIAESQSKLEKHSMEVHLENRIALGLFGERDGEVTYASYAGMTPSSGSKARGDAHRRGDSGASRLNAATTGALGNTKQTEKFAALDRALGHLALSAMVRKLYFPGGFYASAYAYALVECGDDADKVRALQKVFWKLVRYKSNVTLVEANKLVADFGPPYQPSSARGVGNRWHAALKDQLVPLDLDLKITGSAGGYQVNAYENALVEMLNRIPGGPAAPGAAAAVALLDDAFAATTFFTPPAGSLGDIYAAAARRVDDHARARRRAAVLARQCDDAFGAGMFRVDVGAQGVHCAFCNRLIPSAPLRNDLPNSRVVGDLGAHVDPNKRESRHSKAVRRLAAAAPGVAMPLPTPPLPAEQPPAPPPPARRRARRRPSAALPAGSVAASADAPPAVPELPRHTPPAAASTPRTSTTASLQTADFSPAAQSLHSDAPWPESPPGAPRLVDEGMEHPLLPEIRRRLEAIQLSYRSAFVALAPELQRACAVVAADIRDAAVATVDFLASSEF
ncbi:hypothetical protein SO694_00143060 [Aureococcus anophagefferens]|uniref:Uncharacterized protein n=1 Tax=Aureococcus anophagefferens TaxID=44056 RepID=A0ABR1FPN3_AURAN